MAVAAASLPELATARAGIPAQGAARAGIPAQGAARAGIPAQGAARAGIPAQGAALAQPVAMAGDRLLPVLPVLRPLFPAGGLKRGAVVSVTGSTSLALSLLAAASAQGSWCAAVGLPSLGLAAAAELGVVLERFPLVPVPGRDTGTGGWGWVVAALVDAFDVVLARPPAQVKAADARRLTARARERGAVLVVSGDGWPDAAEVQLTVASAVWEGIGQGHGRLRGRRVEVVAGGRGAAARGRRLSLWLPHPDGGIHPQEEVADERRAHARRVVS